MRPQRLTIETCGEPVPAIFRVTHHGAPAALLLHGLSSTKERMCDSIGRALAGRGISSMAIDLPLHGDREGSIRSMSISNPMVIVKHWRLALSDITEALAWLRNDPRIDGSRVALVGYSLGAFLGVHVAAKDRGLAALVLAAGGDFPQEMPFVRMVRTIADPTRDARRISAPLLMVNGRHDRTVTPAQAERLYAAAREPKQLEWYNAGHWPSPRAIDTAADWLAARFGGATRATAG